MGLKVMDGKECHFDFNKKIIEELDKLLSELEDVGEKLSQAEKLVKETFKTSEITTATNKAKRKYNNSFKANKR